MDYGDKLQPCQWYNFTPPLWHIIPPPLTGDALYVRDDLCKEAVEAQRECLQEMDVKVARMAQAPDILRMEVSVEREHPLCLKVEAALARVPTGM